MAVDGVTSLSQGGGGERCFASACTGWASWVTYTTYGPQAAAVFVRARMLLMGCDVVIRTASTRDCRAVMGRKAVFLASGGYGPSSIQRHLLHLAARRAMCSSGSGSSCGAGGGGRPCMPSHAWPPLAPCPHVVMVESGMRAAMAVRCDSERAMRSAECRQPARAAATRLIALSCACTCIAMLSVRMPVHDVVESDRTNRVYSDGKCIFCEYLRLFAARGEHAIARACDGKARGFMVSPACIPVPWYH